MNVRETFMTIDLKDVNCMEYRHVRKFFTRPLSFTLLELATCVSEVNWSVFRNNGVQEIEHIQSGWRLSNGVIHHFCEGLNVIR
jgi:hypothetical protein